MLKFIGVSIITAAIAGRLVFVFVFVLRLLHVARADSFSAAARRLRDKRGGGDLDGGGGGW